MRYLVAILLVAAIVVTAGIAYAGVASLYMSHTADGSAVSDFATGTLVVYAVFDYSFATSRNVRTEVTDSLGLLIYEREGSFEGSGVGSMAVSGQAVFQQYQLGVRDNGLAMQENIQRALSSDSKSRMIEHANQAVLAGSQMEQGLKQLQRYPLSAPAQNHLAQAVAALEAALAEGRAAADFNKSESQIRAHLEQMKIHADTAVDQAKRARDSAGDGAGFPLLDTPDDRPNVTKIYVQGLIAHTPYEWYVSPDGMRMPTGWTYLPLVMKGREMIVLPDSIGATGP